MPGVRRGIFGWDWIGEPPLYWKIILYTAMAELAPALVLDATLSRWARSTPDALHPIALQSRYVSPGMAWYLNNYLWIFFGLFGILAITMLFHRDKIERVR
jgi:hypothetical protein